MHLFSAPAWSILGRKSENLKTTTPGPGSYNPSILKYENSPNYRIGTSHRSNTSTSISPGPGTYNSTKVFSKSPAPITDRSARSSFYRSNNNPGPGSYAIQSKALEGPKYSIQGRRVSLGYDISPGPGRYNPDLNDFTTKERSPAFRIGSASRDRSFLSSTSPGPGAYKTIPKSTGPK